MPHRSRVRVSIGIPEAQVIYHALEPELRSLPTRRARVRLERRGGAIIVDVEAQDLVALRAALNTYLRWISSTSKCLEALASPR